MSPPSHSSHKGVLKRYIASIELILLVGIIAYATLFAIMLNI